VYELIVAQFIFNFDDLMVNQRCRILLVTLVMIGQAQILWYNERRESVKMDKNAATTSTELHKSMTRYAGQLVSLWPDIEVDDWFKVKMKNGFYRSTVFCVLGLQELNSEKG
jgi:hypothetical protein